MGMHTLIHTYQERFSYKYSSKTIPTLPNLSSLPFSPKHVKKVISSYGLRVTDSNPSPSSLLPCCFVQISIYGRELSLFEVQQPLLLLCLISQSRKSYELSLMVVTLICVFLSPFSTQCKSLAIPEKLTILKIFSETSSCFLFFSLHGPPELVFPFSWLNWPHLC